MVGPVGLRDVVPGLCTDRAGHREVHTAELPGIEENFIDADMKILSKNEGNFLIDVGTFS